MATASIQERSAKDGSTTFRIRWDKGVDPATGTRRQGSETVADPATGRTLRVPPEASRTATRGPYPTALAKVQARRAQILAGDEPPDAGKLTVAEFLRRWLEIVAPTDTATGVVYRSVVTHHLNLGLGAVRLAKLTTLDVEGFLAAKREATYAQTYVTKIRAVLQKALGQAVAWRLLATNPCEAVARGGGRRVTPISPAQVWSREHLRGFLDATATDERYGPIWQLLAATGIRVGELVALRWDAIDWAGKGLAVTRTMTRTKAGWIEREGTKSGKSRTVDLDQETLDALRRHRDRQRLRRAGAVRWNNPALVFTNLAGGTLANQTLQDAFRRSATRAGVPEIRIHDLRHTHATQLLLRGIHPKVVSERLGHSTIAITLDLYSHVVPGLQEPAVAAIADILYGPIEVPAGRLVTIS